jgi:hypothetical protein
MQLLPKSQFDRKIDDYAEKYQAFVPCIFCGIRTVTSILRAMNTLAKRVVVTV